MGGLMHPFTRIVSHAAPLDRSDIDTDQIIPARHLKRIERSGYGVFLFEAWRSEPSFALNRPELAGSEILLTGANFGCGSSREHAVWALLDAGFRAVIAPSFADIFASNAAQNGLLTVRLAEDAVQALVARSIEEPSIQLSIDLETQTVSAPFATHEFEIDAEVKANLLAGRDAIATTLLQEPAISAYEARRPSRLPSIQTSGA